MPPIQLALFDVLVDYAQKVERGELKAIAATPHALVFCENFYAQFFQNVVGQEIKGFNLENKKLAVRARLVLKKKRSAAATIQLITWFEKLCDIYPNVLALGYGGGSKISIQDFHRNYLGTLLTRIAAWAKGVRNAALEKKARSTLAGLKKALGPTS
jgi:hypothetical protein